MKVKRVVFPSDQPNWCRVRVLLRQLRERFLRDDCDLDKCAQFHQEIYEVNAFNALSENGGKSPQNCIMYGLFRFLHDAMDEEERSRTVKVTLPFIIDTALLIEKHIPHGGLPILEQHMGKTVELSRRLVSSILSCAFLCLFPERVRDKTAKLNFVNFTNFYDYLTSPSQQAKLRGILHYFNRLRNQGGELSGVITFTRQVMNKEEVPTLESWMTSDLDLCDLVVDENGAIEKAGSDTLQICFSNSFIGGGVLLHGRAQEEIRFSMSPELLSSLLFTERMLENEAVLIRGFEQFSDYEGYGASLVYAGNHSQQAETDQSGNLQTALCAIDAASFKMGTRERQYRDVFLLRDLNKALVGFKLCEERYNTLKPSRSTAKLEPSSSEEDYHTAPENAVSEDKAECLLPESVLAMASGLSDGVIAAAIKQAAALQRAHASSSSNPDHNSNSSCEFSDFSHTVCRSSSPVHHQTSHDLLGVDLDNFLSDGRRRSSNLSDLTSRRSSSTCSTKYSSEFSSEFEEYYESFQKQEQRHGTIKEEVGNTSLYEFANVLATKLLEEGSNAAASSQSDSSVGVKTFESIPLPSATQKPIPLRVSAELYEAAELSTIPEKSHSPGPTETGQKLSSGMVETLGGTAEKEVDQFCSESENNNWFTGIDQEGQVGRQKGSSPYGLENISSLDKDLVENSAVDVGDYANSLSKVIVNMALHDIAMRQHDCVVCRERASSGEIDEMHTKVVNQIMEKSRRSSKETKDGICSQDVLSAKMGHVLAEKTVHGIMVDLKQEFLSGSLCLNPTQPCDIPQSDLTTSMQPADTSVEKSSHSTSEKPYDAKEENTKSFRDPKIKAIDFSDVVDIRLAPSIESPSLEDEMFSFAQAFTDNIISEACREVNRGWLLKSQSRRSSEPSRKTNSIQAFIGGSSDSRTRCVSPSGRKTLHRHYHNRFSVEMSRWHSSEEVSRQKRGFQDETLSSFDELLQRSNPYIPSLDLFSVDRRGSFNSDRGSSRRSSCSGFRDSLLASFEEELILTSADRNASISSSSSGKYKKSRSRSSTSLSPRSNHDGSSVNNKATRNNSYSDNQLNGLFLGKDAPSNYESNSQDGVVQIPVQAEGEDHLVDQFAGSLAGEVMTTAMVSSSEEPFVDAIDVPLSVLDGWAAPKSDNIVSSAVIEAAAIIKSRQSQECRRRMRAIATGNWGCGAFCGDPQLKAMIQWVAASYVRAPTLLYFTFANEQVTQLSEVAFAIKARGWNVGDLMRAVRGFCERTLEEVDRDELPSTTLFHHLLNTRA